MNWDKYGTGCGLLCSTSSVLPYKGWVKSQKVSDRLFGQRTELIHKKQDCQPVGNNNVSTDSANFKQNIFPTHIANLLEKNVYVE
jgi:hypothetical protein